MNTTAMAGQSVAEWIDAQPALLGGDWIGQLEPRKREEAEFHDKDREGHRDETGDGGRSNRRFYTTVSTSRRHMQQWMARHAPGSVFLDFACGHGAQTVEAARLGAALAVGIDISEVSVRNATENAAAAGLTARTRFLQRDCENTGFPDETFDLALCSGMLHHLDLSKAYPELHRIMKPGGRVFCYEALAHNPVIQWYRNRTPELRTSWEKEHILGMRDIRFARQWFQVEHVRFFNMAAPLATFLPDGPIREAGAAVLHAIDGVVTRIPLLQYWSWMVTFELVKPR